MPTDEDNRSDKPTEADSAAPGPLDRLRASLGGRLSRIKSVPAAALPQTETLLLERMVEETMVLAGDERLAQALPFDADPRLATQPVSSGALRRPVLPFGPPSATDDLADTFRTPMDTDTFEPSAESDEPREKQPPVRIAQPSADLVRGGETIGQLLASGQSHNRPLNADKAAVTVRPLPLDVYARIKIELWDAQDGLDAVLERHGVTIETWSQCELRQEALLRDEALAGKHELAAALRSALQAARDSRDATVGPPTLELDLYAAIRVEVEEAELPFAVLEKRGLSSAEWARACKAFRHRAMTEPGFAQKMRDAVALARGEAAGRGR